MGWPFGKSKKSPGLEKLVYKSGEAFFEMQCKYGHTALVPGQGVVGIVLDAKKQFGTEVAVKVMPNGCQLATLRIAGDDGGFTTFAETQSANGERLNPGDLVVWMPGVHNPDLAQKFGDERSGWIGLIIAKIAPESNILDNSLSVICRY